MKVLSRTAALLAAALLFALPSFGQDESGDELVNKLKGQAGKSAPVARGLQTRGLQTRGVGAAAAPTVSTETRSVVFSRGIPAAVKAAAEEDKVALKPSPTAAPGSAVELSYKVDPESKVSRDNILFRKGSADFADDASVAVVVTLAEAIKHPSLKGLQFVIEGHASAEGDAYANLALSQNRAERIVSVLTSLGVEHDRLIPVGFGESQARFPAHSQEGLLKQDRRVLIFRLEK